MPWATVSLGALSAVLATAASNAWNQVFDAQLDQINKPSRPIPSGAISPDAALWFGHACALASLALAGLTTPVFAACVAIGVLGTWIYSAPPLRTKASTVGALLTIAIPRGALVPVAGWSLVHPPTWPDPWMLAGVSFLYVLGAAATKDFADVEGDEAHGCKTLPVVVGIQRAASWVAPFLVVPFVLLIALAWIVPHHASPAGLAGLGAVLSVIGFVAARALVRDPTSLAESSGNHPVWIAMYLLMIALHVGAAVMYDYRVIACP